MKVGYSMILMLFLAVNTLSGCSGRGSDGEESTPTPAAQQTVLTGTAFKGPVKAGTITVYPVRFGRPDLSEAIGRAQTDDSGNYSIDLVSYEGPVLLEVTGGSFIDEVSGLSVNVNAPLRALVPSVLTGTTTTAAITPMTELAFRKATGAGPLTIGSIAGANASVASTFGLKDIVAILPRSGGGSADRKKYAAVCGSFSQLINDNRGAGESLDDALARVMGRMGEEEEYEGKLSTDSLIELNHAISGFNNSGRNETGAYLDSLQTPASGLITLGTVGTENVIAGIDVSINLPAGVVLDADPLTGEVMPGVVTASGEAAAGSNSLVAAKYTPASIAAPARLHIAVVNVAGFRIGEFVTIRFGLASDAGFPASSAFPVASFSAKGLTGAGLGNITCAAPTVSGL